MDEFMLFLKLLVFLPLVLCLIYLTLRLGSKKYNLLQKGRYIKIIEKTQISKDSFILIIKVGDKGWIMGCSQGNMEKLHELTDEEVKAIELQKDLAQQEIINKYDELLKKLKSRRSIK